MTARAVLLRHALAVACAGCVFACAAPARAADEISVFMPNLLGPDGLSSSVTTVLVLQLWQTLRRGDPKTPGTDFGKSAVKNYAVKPSPQDHAAAEAMARDAKVLSQMVLWGSVQPYGDGGIVQAFLSLPEYPRLNTDFYADFRARHEEEWSVRIPLKDGQAVFSVGLPRRRFGFEPIVVPREVLKNYSSIGSIHLYDPNFPNRRLGSIGATFSALEQRGDAALVRSGDITGIARLPQISKHRSEIVDFVGGLVRVFRGDWAGAIDSMVLVTRNPHTPTELRIDAHLYGAMARSKLGQPGHEEIQRALELNPYLARTAAYAVMERIALFEQMTRSQATLGERRSMIRQARETIERHRNLFTRDDPWIGQVLAGLDRIEVAYFR